MDLTKLNPWKIWQTKEKDVAVNTIFGEPIDTPTGQKLMGDYMNQAQSANMGAGIVNAIGGQQANLNAVWQQHQQLAQMAKIMKDPSELYFTLREISNGYIVECNKEQCFCKELSDVGNCVTTLWAKHMVLNKEN